MFGLFWLHWPLEVSKNRIFRYQESHVEFTRLICGQISVIIFSSVGYMFLHVTLLSLKPFLFWFFRNKYITGVWSFASVFLSFNACALHVFVCEELQLPAGVRHDGEHQRSRGCWQVADIWQVGVRFFSFSHPKNIFAILHLKLVQVHKRSYLRKLLYAYICFLRWDVVISYHDCSDQVCLLLIIIFPVLWQSPLNVNSLVKTWRLWQLMPVC